MSWQTTELSTVETAPTSDEQMLGWLLLLLLFAMVRTKTIPLAHFSALLGLSLPATSISLPVQRHWLSLSLCCHPTVDTKVSWK